MCAVLNISPKTYYKYRNKEDPDYYDYLIIKEIFDDSKGTYGYRRIVEGLLQKYGVVMNGKKVLRIMKKYNLMAEYIRKTKIKHKNERIEDNVKPNLLNRNFTTDNSNKVWDTDVTYLIFKGSRAYLSTIIDLYDRHVVSYVISKRNDLKLVMDTLNKAISKEKDVHGLIIHSDQGFQYTSYEYKAICESNGIQISMSRKGTPIDDSPIESWHSLLKKETLYNNNITSLQEYIQLVEEWILFYNTTRLKSKVKKKRLITLFFINVYYLGFTSYYLSLLISNITGRINGFLPVKLLIYGYRVSVTSFFRVANVVFGLVKSAVIICSALFSIL